MSDLSKADIHTLENLGSLAKNAMRSKTILKQLTSLQDRGLIDFDPMETSASLTLAGIAALEEATS